MEADDELFKLKEVNEIQQWDGYQDIFVKESRRKADKILMMLKNDYDLERVNT